MPKIDLPAGLRLDRYEVMEQLGAGWEGEVYLVRELVSGVERAAKIFYPRRNKNGRVSRLYAQRLHKLRRCSLLIQYHSQETVWIRNVAHSMLISEYVEGELLSAYIARQPEGRLHRFEALHLLHALCIGIEEIHNAGEYHGDLHADNVIVLSVGLRFELKLVDLFHWESAKREARQDDIVALAHVLYDALGGVATYRDQPATLKSICCGRRRNLILERFPRVAKLRARIEGLDWDE